MKITLLTDESINIEPLIPTFRDRGVEVFHNQLHPDCDFILNTCCYMVNHLEFFHQRYPKIPIVNYVLDFYKSVHSYTGKRYDWMKYKDYLSKSLELWCPSNEVILRMEEEGIDRKKCKLIKMWARFFEYDAEVISGDYILNPMRDYILDKNFGWLQRASEELNIPVVAPKHNLSERDFQKTIAECRFLCTEYDEASTGGLTLVEGYRLGKPVVISDSKYMGASDYLKDNAIYFNNDSYDDFKRVIKETWDNTPKLDRDSCVEFLDSNIPSLGGMVDMMIERFEELKRNE